MRADGTSSRALLGYRMVQIESKDRKAAQESATGQTTETEQQWQDKVTTVPGYCTINIRVRTIPIMRLALKSTTAAPQFTVVRR